MAPVFYGLEAEVEEIAGVPTELNRMLLDDELDIAPIPSIEYARNADRLRILPRLCVSSEGAVDSIQLVTKISFGQIRSVAVTPESATSVVLVRILLPKAEIVPLGFDADATLLIGDAALRSAFEDPTPHFDLGRLWLDRTGLPMVFAVWAAPEPVVEGLIDLEHALVVVGAARPLGARAARAAGERDVRLPRRLPRALLREAPLQLRPARARRAAQVPRDGPRRRRAPGCPGAPLRARGGRGVTVVADPAPTVREALDKALDGERISDEDAIALLRSRDLVAVGRVANEVRNRLNDPSQVTFIVDRNLNYTNVCVTDCDFCAFYRRPGDQRESYLLPKPVIFKKIEETLALGGTGLLMQGGHHPDLGIDYYEDLFRSIKARYPIYLHALSPPEIQHIARRSKLTDRGDARRVCAIAGLDSVPGGGAEILVDRVRRIIAPKKTKSDEWLDVMRQAHRLGMSTTATMMYGHVETLEERVEHMRRIRELQDETRGFRAFISWTFQRDGNRLDDLVPEETRPTSFDYLLTQAVSRIYLDNVPHIQSSWVTQGMKIGQVALGFGADDMGSVMIEENVVSAAGTTYRTTTDELVHLIRSAGKTPVQRDTLYREVRVF